jgi:hypothetical protein
MLVASVTDPLASVLAELEQFGKANDASTTERARRMLNITRDTGEFLAVLVRATLARRVLEPLENEVHAFDVALLAQAFDQGLIEVGTQPVLCECDHPDAKGLFRRLCVAGGWNSDRCSEPPSCRRAAEQGDEIAPLHLRAHSITWSARRRNDSGIDSPIDIEAANRLFGLKLATFQIGHLDHLATAFDDMRSTSVDAVMVLPDDSYLFNLRRHIIENLASAKLPSTPNASFRKEVP